MIARVGSGRYVALCLYTMADGRQVWRPIGVVETSLTAAVRACVRSIDERFQRLRIDIAAARAQSQPERSKDDHEPDVLRAIESEATSLHREIAHLLDEPTAHDTVDLTIPLQRARLSPHQVKAGRVLAGLGLRELAERAGRSFSAVQAIESGSTRRPRPATLAALRSVLIDAGVEFDSAGWVRHGDDGEALTLASTPDPVAR